ncbi:hypothetical protein U1Q18_040353 [Sarracenia purpurea var. burkii]
MVSDPTTQSTYEGNPEYREKEEGSVKVGRASKINSPPSGKGDFAETKGKGESGVDDDTGQGGETKKVSFASAPVSRICRDDQNVKGGDTNQPCEQPQGAAYAQESEKKKESREKKESEKKVESGEKKESEKKKESREKKESEKKVESGEKKESEKKKESGEKKDSEKKKELTNGGIKL